MVNIGEIYIAKQTPFLYIKPGDLYQIISKEKHYNISDYPNNYLCKIKCLKTNRIVDSNYIDIHFKNENFFTLYNSNALGPPKFFYKRG